MPKATLPGPSWPCPRCSGSGSVFTPTPGGDRDFEEDDCPACDGTGWAE